MATFDWTTKDQAYLAKIAGYEVSNLPDPTTKEQQLLKDIAQKEASEVKLPKVTTTDNGDVLTVVEGAWAKAAPSGGDGAFVVTVEQDGGNYTSDKTIAEIKAAAEVSSNVIAKLYDVNSPSTVWVMPLTCVGSSVAYFASSTVEYDDVDHSTVMTTRGLVIGEYGVSMNEFTQTESI